MTINNIFDMTELAVVCSGTASLEITKREIPQLVIYKLNLLTELIGSFFIKIKYACIINIFENKMIIPELTNSKLNKKDFIIKFKSLLIDKKFNYNQIKESRRVINQITQKKPPYKYIVENIKKII